MARPSIPIAAHRLRGTFRKGRHAGKTSLAADKGPGACPEWFKQEERDEWQRLTTHPEYSRFLKEFHRGALLEYCILYSRMIRDAKSEKPMLDSMSASERQTLHSLRMQLCLTLATESKLPGGRAPADPNNWDDL